MGEAIKKTAENSIHVAEPHGAARLSVRNSSVPMVQEADAVELPVDYPPTHVGADIRALRKSRNMTLSDLCHSLDRSVGWLSQVERGQTDPSIPDLKLIAALFSVPVSFFFRNDDAPENERGWIVRAGSRAVIGSPEDGLKEELLSPDLGGDFEMIRSVFEPGAVREVMQARDTQDGGFVVSGQLELTIGETVYMLKAGDSFQFDRQPYGWRNTSNEPAVVVWIISPPIY